MSFFGNIYQSRVSAKVHKLPVAISDEEIAVYANPGHWKGSEKNVILMVGLNAAALSPVEARQLAQDLLTHANQAEASS